MNKRVLALLACAGAPLVRAELPPLPASPKIPVVETVHDERLTDDYRWLEGSAAPELAGKPDAALDAKVRVWSEAQNARTRAYFDSVPGRAALEQRLRTLLKVDSLSAPRVRGGREFFTRRQGDATNGTLNVRENGAERVLLDVDKLYPDGRTTLAETSVSPEGTRVAFGLYKSGDENTTLRVLDVATGRWLGDTITGKAGSVSWLPGSESFVYSKLADVKNPYSRQILYHRIGEDPAKDRLIFEQYKTGPLATTYGPGASVDHAGKWLVLTYHTGTSTSDVWVCDFPRWLKTGELVRVPVTVGENATVDTIVRDDTMWLKTTAGAKNGRVIKIDLLHPEPENRREIIAEDKDRPLTGLDLSKSYLVATRHVDGLNAIELLDLNGKPVRPVSLPGVGVGGLSVDEESDTGYLSFSAFNTPPSTWRTELKTDARELYFRPAYAVDSDRYEVKALRAPSKDGTLVPLWVVHRKGLVLNGDNPTILYGYGGFSAGQKPGFISTLVPWLDAGGVFALAGLRGGDEFGQEWHKAGMLDRKQNVFDDCIGCAEFLIREKYTSPARLGVRGGSNGGLLTGAMVTQRPDLFGAVNIGVPLLDMVRFPSFLMAKYWIPEYGDPAKAEDYKWIRAYSPYHHVKDGVKYPAVLLEAGEKDARVHPMHAKKMAARLQAATASDPEKSPVLLWVDFDSGHGMGKSFEMRVRDSADTYLFFAKQLGLDFSAKR